jgi:hypothetical protein
MSETTYEVTANAEDEEGDNEGTMGTTTAHDGEEEEKKGAEKKKGRKKKGTTATAAEPDRYNLRNRIKEF